MITANFESKWGRLVDSVQIPTWTERATLSFLAELASKSERIIEVGTYLGASAKVMLLANPKLKLFCVDMFCCQDEPMMLRYLTSVGEINLGLSTFDICRQHSLKPEVDEGRCFLIAANSRNSTNMLQNLFDANPLADAVWIDGGHDTPTVLDDIKNMMPFLKAGGEMVGHDFDVPHNDVATAVISSGIAYDVPIPRMWRHIKKSEDVITVETGYPM